MLRTCLEPPIVKSGGKVENFADEVILAQSALILYNPKNLDTADGVFHFDAGTRYLGIGGLLLGCEFLSLGFLHRLNNGCILRVISLISGILLKIASIGKRVHFISDSLVVHLPFNSKARKSINPARQVITAFLTVCLFFFPL